MIMSFYDIITRPVTYNLNKISLESNFKEFQKAIHPDKFSNASDVRNDYNLFL